ncbi:hypothetical protein E2C01_027144 [Portunus trituberculatus]|uniref:Uncharacterized protein n=1 Tax=Portunus trituberculatus TaxID=210409 RepID=A0A5B7EL67_PORTR|nr:hypothetical protein [Portunus trituberculatus]
MNKPSASPGSSQGRLQCPARCSLSHMGREKDKAHSKGSAEDCNIKIQQALTFSQFLPTTTTTTTTTSV